MGMIGMELGSNLDRPKLKKFRTMQKFGYGLAKVVLGKGKAKIWIGLGKNVDRDRLKFVWENSKLWA